MGNKLETDCNFICYQKDFLPTKVIKSLILHKFRWFCMFDVFSFLTFNIYVYL